MADDDGINPSTEQSGLKEPGQQMRRGRGHARLTLLALDLAPVQADPFNHIRFIMPAPQQGLANRKKQIEKLEYVKNWIPCSKFI